MRMTISNDVKYYKTVQEAFAAANPSMRKILCPQPGPADAAKALVGKIDQFSHNDITPDKADNIKNTINTIKSIFKNQTKELKFLDALEKCINYMTKGDIGEVLFKFKLKSDKNFAETLREVGFQA